MSDGRTLRRTHRVELAQLLQRAKDAIAADINAGTRMQVLRSPNDYILVAQDAVRRVFNEEPTDD